MKYYSEKLLKVFDTEVALREAETDYEVAMIEKRREAEHKANLQAEQRRRAQEVTEAYKAYALLLAKYCIDFNIQPIEHTLQLIMGDN